MNSFIFNSKIVVLTFLVVTMIAVIGGLAATEILVRERVLPVHSAPKYNALFKSSKSRDAIFGDSHAAYGLTGLNGFVNLAYGGSNFDGIATLVREYYATREPRQVILQAGPHHFSNNFLYFRKAEEDELRELIGAKPPLGLVALSLIHRKELLGYWRLFLSRKEFVPVQTFMPDGSRLSKLDYSQTPKTIQESAASRTEIVLRPIQPIEGSRIAKLYVDTIAELQARGGEVCLVTFPLASALRQLVRKDKAFAAAQSFFGDLARRFGIVYADFLLLDLPDSMFSDPHHLNDVGARHVSALAEKACSGA